MKKNRLLTCLLALTLAGCSSSSTSSTSSEVPLYSNLSADAGFDTVFYYQEYNTDTEASQEHFELATQLFTYYNNLFDIYNDYEGVNNLKTVNDNAGIQPVEVDEDLIEMLQLAQQFNTWSQGEFDITIGSLLQVWHEYREEGLELNENGEYGNLPTDEELSEASQYSGWDKVEIDDENNTVYITDENVSLDVGGIAKGFATEKIAQKIESLDNVGTVTINAGGNNRTIGTKPDGSNWRVRIQNPDGGSKLIIVSQEGSMSFVTSGDYERFYYGPDGISYHHIIDPETLYPATKYRSVSIITKDSGAADCLSTTLFTLSIEDGQKVLEEYETATGETVNAIWIMDEDQKTDGPNLTAHMGFYIAYTEGLNNHITFETE